MFFLVVAGAVHTGRGGGFSFLAGEAEPLFKTVIPRDRWGLQPLASTWLRDAGHNAWLCVINERHPTHTVSSLAPGVPNRVVYLVQGAASGLHPKA